MRYAAVPLLLAAFATAAPSSLLAAQLDGCSVSAGVEDRIEAIDSRGELTLASGMKAVLTGIRWPDDAEVSRQAVTWLGGKRGLSLSVSIRGEPDRWGRRSIDAAFEGADLAGSLVAAGLALADAGEADTFCRADLLAREEAPRRTGQGAWARAILDAGDGAAYAAHEGDFVVAEGRILSAVERPKRTYLNFTTREKRGLSVTVSKRTWRIMLERGLTAGTLKGRFVRVRGTVEIWQGPILDIVSADMIEVMDGGAAPRR